MPELAEVEFFRRRWTVGEGQRIRKVAVHGTKRLFRGVHTPGLVRVLTGARMTGSAAHGKQMLFRFSRQAWLGVHLGMTGELRVEPPAFVPGKHDHLVLFLSRRALVFSDARQFGRIRFHQGAAEPEWWRNLPPAVNSRAFTLERMANYLTRHARAPLKAVLLAQDAFPGVGNWMADEILWRARLHPAQPAGRVHRNDVPVLWRAVRSVCRDALRLLAPDYADPPASWLFRHRWEPGGRCPRHRVLLERDTVGGRTTAWCPRCQVDQEIPKNVRYGSARASRSSSKPSSRR
ncbi:MAG TPA: DNA-formamidopyrimidine glycosylase family protein [Verrucomicrobiae bacterium]|nr:DNA-formamidopyrimidine glycosylase family protein [Verrucomicrobiae bacterium]